MKDCELSNFLMSLTSHIFSAQRLLSTDNYNNYNKIISEINDTIYYNSNGDVDMKGKSPKKESKKPKKDKMPGKC